MAVIEGLNLVLAALKDKERQAVAAGEISVVVGYTQKYALWVHENLQARHAGHTLYSSRRKKWYQGQGQAKFLEQPARQNQAKYAAIIVAARKQGKTLEQALLLAGLALQRDSQQLCPVDTSALKASAVTRLEKK